MEGLSELPKDNEVTSSGHGFENPLPHEGQAVKSSSPQSSPRFLVEQVQNESKDKMEFSDSDSGAHSRVCSDSSRPISIVDGTIGYATNEAVPMTVFYRNEHSQSHAKKYRPTLQELQKGFEEVPDQQPENDANQANSVEDREYQNSNNLKVYTHGEKIKVAPKFGWMKGVMLRCLLNIWGVMLFLRLTWVVGQSGIGWSTVIIMLSALVTVLTTLSMSAVCTNGEVKGGGAYFLISRSLGPEFGGSIGLIFSLANAVAVALYVVGFAETVRDILRDNDSLMVDEVNDIRIVGILTMLVLLSVTLVGLEWVVRTQMFLLGILLISIVDVIVGTFLGPQNEVSKARGFMGYKMSIFESNFGSEYRSGENFFSVFAVFFPAATGILAGVNISGDLRDAQKAIPKGTFLAIVLSTIIYVLLAWFAGACVLRDGHGFIAAVAAVNASVPMNGTSLPSCPGPKCQYGLMNDFQVMEKISAWGPLVTGGIFAATLSSALASLVGAPKTFQALCKDNIFPYIDYFGVGLGPGEEPRRGYLLTFLIAAAFIAIGELNVIAPVISNFFLMSYALINYAVFAASLARSPGWRPSFKYYNMWVSLVGALLCVAIMFLINWWAALVTIVIVTALYKYVDIKKPNVNWGSSAQAYTYIRALRFSYRLNTTEDHVKNFRPQCLVLTGSPSLRPNLTYIVSQITRNVGLMICGQVNVGPFARVSGYENGWLNDRKIRGFHTICTAPTLRAGVQGMLQSTGVGKLKPNTLVLGFKRNWKRASDSEITEYVSIINDAFEMNYGVAILRMRDEYQIGEDEFDGDVDDWMGDGEEEHFVPKSRSASKTSFSERPTSQGSGIYSEKSQSTSGAGRFFHVERAMTPESVGLLDEPSDIDTVDKSKGYTEGRKKFVVTENVDLNDSEHSQKETSSFAGSAAPVSELDYPEGSTRVEVGSLATTGGLSVKTSDLSVSETLTLDSEKNKDHTSEKSGLTEPLEDASKSKSNKAEDLLSTPISFRGKQKGTIDVWWLSDDGGLTILIPYILSLNHSWKDCKLRIFTPASTRNIKNNEVRMANLLKKFRIDFSSIEEVHGIDKPPSRKCIEEFLKLPSQGEFEEAIPLDKRMLRQIRTGELLRQHSKDARLIVMTLPVPKLGMMSARLYMSWLEVLSADLPPVLMVRGNQTSVLTFYC